MQMAIDPAPAVRGIVKGKKADVMMMMKCLSFFFRADFRFG